ncbi:putative phage tail protein [Entomobacter blattae]|uniref:Phage tail protein n=1 Tax=Entomobacter blattae TaxID=2762277 RepID=A0A7H1NUJ5_9PROT|nr:putative phage tail protein [Entomobacter blattae]QNT79455.1 hypothetical protein JGUZn3_22540 [Entomobacter blattae]
MIFNNENFTKALLDLFPKGPIWNRLPDGPMAFLCKIWAQPFARNAARAEVLLTDVFPGTSSETLPEWEKTVGLPDPNLPALDPSLEGRRTSVVNRLTDTGQSDQDYYISIAKSYGYPITITFFSPLVFGQTFGLAFRGEVWAHVWQVNAPEASSSVPGGKAQLEQILRALAPPHTIVIFNYI